MQMGAFPKSTEKDKQFNCKNNCELSAVGFMQSFHTTQNRYCYSKLI